MRGKSILQSMRSGLGQVTGLSGDRTRRMAHGGSAWSLPNGMRQPQDGASAPIAAATPSVLATMQRHGHMLLEPEDARITGGTRSLTRRLLGLNVTDARRPVAASASPMVRRVA